MATPRRSLSRASRASTIGLELLGAGGGGRGLFGIAGALEDAGDLDVFEHGGVRLAAALVGQGQPRMGGQVIGRQADDAVPVVNGFLDVAALEVTSATAR